MKVTVDKNLCIGCGSCAALAPKTFKLDPDGKAETIEPPGDTPAAINDARDGCAVQAIKIE